RDRCSGRDQAVNLIVQGLGLALEIPDELVDAARDLPAGNLRLQHPTGGKILDTPRDLRLYLVDRILSALGKDTRPPGHLGEEAFKRLVAAPSGGLSERGRGANKIEFVDYPGHAIPAGGAASEESSDATSDQGSGSHAEAFARRARRAADKVI